MSAEDDTRLLQGSKHLEAASVLLQTLVQVTMLDNDRNSETGQNLKTQYQAANHGCLS